MALNKIELIDVIKRHNDPNDATTIISIQGTSVSNFFPERMRKGDIISIDNDDIVWKEYADDSDTPLIYRTGLDNIDTVKFIPAPGSYTVKDNGRVESTNTRTTVESPDGTVLRMVPGPQGDKGERGEPGPRGERGPKPEITINPVNDNWIIDGVDTNVNAVGPKGDKVEITINSANKHWIIDGVDTNIVAEGKDGKTPTVEIDNATKRWKINGVDTNIVAEGTKGEKGDKTVVTIDPVTKHWMIDGSDTNIVAEGTKGEKGEAARIHIDPDNKHFIINGNDSGVRAEGIKGEDGATPDIKINEVSKHWMINGVDTQIKAEGTKGEKGDKALVTIDSNNKHWLIDGVDTGIVAEGTRGTDGINGKSAYEIALETGYVGSKEDWITSLKGEDGAEGSAGRDANSLNMNIALLGRYRNNDATGIKAIAVKPTLNDTELDKEQVKEQVKVTARFRGLNLRNSNENDDWKTIPNLSMDYDGDEIYVKGLPFTDGVRKGDPLEIIFSFTYKGITTHCYRRLENINDGVGSVNLDNYIRREDLPTTLDTSHLIGRTEVEENYAKKSELPVVPSLEGYAKSVDVANDYATKQSVEEVKNDLNTEKGKISELSGKITTLEADKRLLATKQEVDETYAKKTDIPTVHSLEGYAKITEVERDYAKKSEISALADLNNKVNTSDLANYYTKTETISKGEYDTLKNTVDANTGEITKLSTKASKLDTLDETYAKKTELPNVTGLVSEVTADSKYAKITEVERDYAKKTDIPAVPSLEGYAIKSEIDGIYAKKSELPVIPSLVEYAKSADVENIYAKKSDIPTVHSLEGYAKITEIEKDYAKKSELPSVTGLISETDADNKYAKKTDIPSLEDYARKSDIPTVHSLEGYAKLDKVEEIYAKKSELPSIAGFITEATADNKYAKKKDIPSLEGYAKTTELPSVAGLISEATADSKYAKVSDLESTYAKKSDIPTVHSLEGYAKTSEIESTYAKKSELPSVAGFITEATANSKYVKLSDIEGNVNELVFKAEVDSIDNRFDTDFLDGDHALSKRLAEETYAKKTELPTVPSLEGYAKITEIEKDYAKKSEIPSVSGLISETYANNKYAKKTDIPSITGLLSETTAETTYVKKSELPSTTGFITEVDADSRYAKKTEVERDYAKKSELPNISGLISETSADNKYAKKTELPTVPSLDGYAKKTEIPSINGLLSETFADNKYAKKTDIPSLDGYAKKTELPSTAGFITETYADNKYAKKTDIPSGGGGGGSSYDDTALSNRIKALEAKDYELRGNGMPEGVVSAPVGTTYVDEKVTNGALKWIKRSGTGNTGWDLLIGDTGWRTLRIASGLGNSYIKVRRINNQVHYQFGGLQWGWFGILRRNAPGYLSHPGNREKKVYILTGGQVPLGFRTESSLIGNIYNDDGVIYGTWYLGGPGDGNHLRFQFSDPVPTDRDIGDIRISSISYATSDSYPKVLP